VRNYSKTDDALLISSRKHTGERPFQCHCSRRFSRLDNLRQHAQTVHVNEEIPMDSLAATGTRFQRQVRTDRVRPPGNRSRASTAGSQTSQGRGHHRNSLSASSIGSIVSARMQGDDHPLLLWLAILEHVCLMRTTVRLRTVQVSIKHIDNNPQAGIVHQPRQLFLQARTVHVGARVCSHPYRPIPELQVSMLGTGLRVDDSRCLLVQTHSNLLMVRHLDRRHWLHRTPRIQDFSLQQAASWLVRQRQQVDSHGLVVIHPRA
jgi:hypothetical protein